MGQRMMGREELAMVKATCGHTRMVSVPPHGWGRQPGPVGQQRIAKAQSEPCWPCKDGKPIVGTCAGCGMAITNEWAAEFPIIITPSEYWHTDCHRKQVR